LRANGLRTAVEMQSQAQPERANRESGKILNERTTHMKQQSKGIAADRLARRGYDLLLVARSREPMEDLAKRLAADTGLKVRSWPPI
jgi:hypothetical protein